MVARTNIRAILTVAGAVALALGAVLFLGCDPGPAPGMAGSAPAVQDPPAAEPFKQPPLPYARDAMAPYVSAETFEYHYGKHQKAYVDILNRLVAGTPNEKKPLEAVIMGAEGPLFNASAQVWNHTFFWNSLKPGGGGEPTGKLAEAIRRDFGSYAGFRAELVKAATGLFGSGWAWLVLDGDKLRVIQTSNADLPMKHGQEALLVIDVWEHAYYIDYRNARPKYVDAVVDHLVNWDFAAANYARATQAPPAQ